MTVIETKGLTKSFDGKTNALENLDLSIPEGSVFGFLGPNGAGKTTAIRLINGILTPTTGDVYLMGKKTALFSRENRALCGVMTENASLYESLTGVENLSFFGQMFGMNTSESAKRADELLETFELKEAQNKKVKTYSTGMKKRLSLARALLHRPKILFLDEPTSGLDPEAARSVNLFIHNAALQEKVTVFLCTHQLRYAEDICSLYGFIDKGKLLGFGTFQDLMKVKNTPVRLSLRGINIPGNIGLEPLKDGSYERNIQGDEEASKIIHHVIQAGGSIYEAKQLCPDLEDLYFSYQKDSIPVNGGK